MLNRAQKQKKDEFYTQLVDIENELLHYQNQFAGKTAVEEYRHNNVDEKEAVLGELEAIAIPLTRDAIFIDQWYQRLLRVYSSIGEKFVDASLQALVSELPNLALQFLSMF